MRTHPLRPNLVLVLACLLTVLLFLLDTAMPEAHFWGRYLLPILLVFLWGNHDTCRRDIYIVTALASALIVGDSWFERTPGAADMLINHVLPITVLWLVAWVLVQRQRDQDRLAAQRRQQQEQSVHREHELDEQVNARTAALQASEEQLAKVFRANPGGIAITRQSDGSFLEANDAYLDIVGYTREQLVGRTSLELDILTFEQRDRIRAAIQENGSVRGMDVQIRNAQGQTVDAVYSAEQLAFGGEPCFLILVVDVTERTQIEAHARQLAAIVEAAHEAIISANIDGTVISVNRSAEALYGVSAAQIVGRNIKDIAVQQSIPGFQEMLDRVTVGEIVTADDGTWTQLDGTVKTLAVSISPIRDGAGHITAFAALARDTTERKAAEREATRLAAIVQNSLDAIISADFDGTLRSMNRAAEQLFGINAAEAVGQHISLLNPDLPASERAAMFAQLQAGEAFTLPDFTWQAHDGRCVDLAVTALPLLDTEGQAMGVASIARDITARKRLEDQLRQSEERFRLIVENSPEVIALYNEQGILTYISPALEVSHGFTAELALAVDPLLVEAMVTPPGEGPHAEELAHIRALPQFADRCKTAEIVSLCLEHPGVQQLFEFSNTRASGEVRDFDATYRAHLRADGTRQVVSITRDITERKRLEHTLAASERKYRDLYDNSPDMYMSGYPTDHIIRDCNQTLARTLGHTREELIGQPNSIVLTPASYHTMLAELPKYAAAGEYANLEVQLQCKGGTVLDALMSGHLDPATADRPAYSRVTLHDVTEGKQLEDALRQSEQKWRSVFEFLPVGVSVIDTNNHVTDTNAALAQVLGMTTEGILQGSYAHRRYFRADGSPMPPEEFPSQRALREGIVVRDVEIGVEKEDGELIWVNVSATPSSLDGYAVTVTTDITARKRLEAEVRHSEAQLRAVIENTADSVWSVDRSYGYLVGNSVFVRGVAQQIGRPLAVGDCVVAEPFPPSSRAFWQPLYDRALAGESFVIEVPSALHPGGTLALYQNPIYAADGTVTGVSGRTADITALKQAEAQLRTAYQRVRLAAEAADIGIWNWNFADNSLEWDDRMCDLYGIPEEQRRERITYDIWRARIHPDDLALAEQGQVEPGQLGSQWSGGYRIVRPDGAVRYVQVSSVMEYDRDGSPQRMIGINRDITDQKLYEQLLHDTNTVLEQRVVARTADLQAALADLQRANQLKDEFLAMMSHELRTPLMGVLSMAEMLKDEISGPLTARQATYVQAITKSGERLLAVINGILGYTHLLSGKVQLHAEPCDLGYLLATCAASQQYKAAEKRQAIAVEVTPPELTITSDATALAEVLKRLLDNALKFTPDGGQVGLEAHLSSAPDQANGVKQIAVDLVVWDTGIGIAPDQQEHVFHAFTQADARLSRSHEGIGLGLAYVEEMVRLLGGTIALNSTPGQGSRFTVTLPT